MVSSTKTSPGASSWSGRNRREDPSHLMSTANSRYAGDQRAAASGQQRPESPLASNQPASGPRPHHRGRGRSAPRPSSCRSPGRRAARRPGGEHRRGDVAQRGDVGLSVASNHGRTRTRATTGASAGPRQRAASGSSRAAWSCSSRPSAGSVAHLGAEPATTPSTGSSSTTAQDQVGPAHRPPPRPRCHPHRVATDQAAGRRHCPHHRACRAGSIACGEIRYPRHRPTSSSSVNRSDSPCPRASQARDPVFLLSSGRPASGQHRDRVGEPVHQQQGRAPSASVTAEAVEREVLAGVGGRHT